MNKENKLRYFKRGFGDRYDGWRVKNINSVIYGVPFFLRTRMDAQNLYEESVDIDVIEEFIKNNKDDIPNLSVMHVLMAACIRLISQRPQLNRFIVWNKIFARNYLSFSIVVKRSLSDDGEETLVKPYFLPTDTLKEVVDKVVKEQLENQQVGQKNTMDIIADVLTHLPDFMYRLSVFSLLRLDSIGLLPKFVHRASAWHSSVFLTNIGSIGAESIYHHLYEFGTCSMYISMGKKIRKKGVDNDSVKKYNKSLHLKFVMDERICDGFYYSSSMKMLKKYLLNPTVLLTPPEKVIVDEGVGKKRIDL